MSHFVTGLIARSSTLESFASSRTLPVPIPLNQGLAFLPLRDKDIASLLPEAQTGYAVGFNYLSTQLASSIAGASKGGTVVYVETEYFGGAGAQGAAVFCNGAITFGPKSAESGPINEALRLLGVVVTAPASDEFETVGLNRRRHTEDWVNT